MDFGMKSSVFRIGGGIWVVVAFQCAKLKYVMLFSLFIIFVQVFSIQLITKQSEMLPDFFPFFRLLLLFSPFHVLLLCFCSAFRACTDIQNTDMWTMCQRQWHKKRALFVILHTHIVRFLARQPVLLTFQYVQFSAMVFDIIRLLLLFVSPFISIQLFVLSLLLSLLMMIFFVLLRIFSRFFSSALFSVLYFAIRYLFECLFQCCHFMFYYR